MFYRLIKEPHVCIQPLFTLPTFYIIFILFPTPCLPRFYLVLCSICIPELEFEPYQIFSQCSQRIVRLRPNIFILSQSDFFSSTFEYINPCFIMFYHQMFSLAMGSNFRTTTSHFVHSSLANQLYATVINFVTKPNNPVQHAPNIHPKVFKSFHKIIIHEDSFGIFTNPSLSNKNFLSFTIEPLPSVTYPPFFIRTLKTIPNIKPLQ